VIGVLAALAATAPMDASCDAPTTFQQVSRELVAGEQAIRDSDREALEDAERRAEALMSCLGEPLSPSEVASFMRLKGIASFVRKDREGATRWLEAARAVDPSYALPLTLIPKAHPLRTLFESVRVPPLEPVHLPPPATGWLEIDGRQASNVYAGHPWVLQWRDGDGQVVSTVLGEGRPAAWPYKVSSVERATVGFAGALQYDLEGLPGAGRAGVAPTAVLPAPGPFAVELGLQAMFTEVYGELRVVPGASGGLRAWLVTGPVQPYGAVALAAASHRDRPLVAGPAGAVGVRVGRDRFAEIEARASYVGAPLLQASVGLGWAVP
jgi:hypothetical protein